MSPLRLVEAARVELASKNLCDKLSTGLAKSTLFPVGHALFAGSRQVVLFDPSLPSKPQAEQFPALNDARASDKREIRAERSCIKQQLIDNCRF